MSSGRQTEHIADKHGLSLLPKDMKDYERANESSHVLSPF